MSILPTLDEIFKGKFNLFCNPIFLLYHTDFWYTHPTSPVVRQKDMPWDNPPLQLLSISATAVSLQVSTPAIE